MPKIIPRIALTVGEPAGIGPDLVIAVAQRERTSEIVALGSPELLAERAAMLNADLKIVAYDAERPPQPGQRGTLLVSPTPLAEAAHAGQLNSANSAAVIATLEQAAKGCMAGEFAAMVTAPVQKSVIAEAGFNFSGHTEFLAELCGAPLPVMLLCADELRVALLTTHLPLSEVPASITTQRILATSRILAHDLGRFYGIQNARIAMLGLNPHAGESGKLGREEIEIIEPAVRQLQSEGLRITGPLPADSAFTPASLRNFDAVLAMYHDQGLPVLKHAGFGNAVNVTLGLPIVRTSVDHGTALDLAGTGRAEPGSLFAAIELAEHIISASPPPS